MNIGSFSLSSHEELLQTVESWQTTIQRGSPADATQHLQVLARQTLALMDCCEPLHQPSTFKNKRYQAQTNQRDAADLQLQVKIRALCEEVIQIEVPSLNTLPTEILAEVDQYLSRRELSILEQVSTAHRNRIRTNLKKKYGHLHQLFPVLNRDYLYILHHCLTTNRGKTTQTTWRGGLYCTTEGNCISLSRITIPYKDERDALIEQGLCLLVEVRSSQQTGYRLKFLPPQRCKQLEDERVRARLLVDLQRPDFDDVREKCYQKARQAEEIALSP